jgi:hypothetical protein
VPTPVKEILTKYDYNNVKHAVTVFYVSPDIYRFSERITGLNLKEDQEQGILMLVF